jgi:hypothetical protein
MEEETFAGIVTKIEKMVQPLGFEIQNIKRQDCHSDGFLWNKGPNVDKTSGELTIVIACEIRLNKTFACIISEVEKLTSSLHFRLEDAEQLCKSDNKVTLRITLVRFGNLG